MSRKNVDFIIVGQGIVGSLLAHFLLKENKSVLVIDKQIPGAASLQSSGIINPITGRRFAKSWQIDILLPYAKTVYQEIEDLIGANLVSDITFCKLINSIKEENDLAAAMDTDENLPYFPAQEKSFLDPSKYSTPLGYYQVEGGLRIDIVTFLRTFKDFLQKQNSIVEELFEYEALDLKHNVYKDTSFGKLIFCQGFANIHNPFFSDMDVIPNKGEFLIIKTKIPHELEHTITSNGIISPISHDTLYVGATYLWVGEDTTLTNAAVDHLRAVFEHVCTLEYDIVSQGVGLRPATKNRRPILGMHKEYTQLGIFNGMGTKGTMLAPFYAHQFAQFLVHNTSIDIAVDF